MIFTIITASFLISAAYKFLNFSKPPKKNSKLQCEKNQITKISHLYIRFLFKFGFNV